MNPLILNAILNSIYSDFDMFLFDNRLKLQKVIYFLQEVFGIQFGYEFKWFTRGPYSTELAKDGFLVDNFKNPPELKFSLDEDNAVFEKFRTFIEPHKNEILWLEIATSIHILKRVYPEKNKEQLIREVMGKRDELNNDPTKKKITEVWSELEASGLLK